MQNIRLALTVGDPTGIGPEICAHSVPSFLKSHRDARLVLFAPRQAFTPRELSLLQPFEKLGLLHFQSFTTRAHRWKRGDPNKASGIQALEDLERATSACINEVCDALVTGPLDKYWCALSKKDFRGHTEYLQKASGSKFVTMLLSGSDLRVALVTTHIPLKSVSRSITSSKIVSTTKLLHRYLSSWIKKPKIAVLGLNPHASDRGLFGNEEKLKITPAIQTLQRLGISATGPYSPDSFFARPHSFDGVICMYHDQGLIPLKLKHFETAVNITLGLPFLRTSVDHGPAFDIAGSGRASSLSYGEAIESAFQYGQRIRGRALFGSRPHSSSRRTGAQSKRSLARYS